MRAFLITLGGLALLVQPGPYLNDEVGQLAALTSLADGHLLVQSDLPEGYDVWRGWGAMNVPLPGQDPRPNAGSTMTNVLALPMLGTLRVLEVPLGPMGAVGLLASIAVGAGVWAAQGAARRPVDAGQGPGDDPAGRKDLPGWRVVHWPWLGAAAGSGLFVGAVVMQVLYKPPSSPYLEAASLQFLAIAFHAFAAALIYDMLRSRVRQPAMGTAVFAFGTPALFWALNLKYHGVGISLAAICLWLYQEGHRTRPLRTLLAFAVAGLAVWNHLPNGLLVLGSLSLIAIPSVLLGLKPFAARVAAGAAGLAIGLLPEVWDRMAHNALEARDRFIQVGGGSDVPQQLARQSEAGRLRWTIWNDPAGPFDAFWQMVFWIQDTTPLVGSALPLLALIPVIVLLPWAYRRPLQPLMVWPVLHVLLMLALFGRGLFLNGDAYDLRHSATMWPFLALPLATVLDRVPPRLVGRSGGAIVAAMTAIVWVPFYAVRQTQHYSVLMHGPIGDLVEPLRYIGVVVAAAILLIWLVPRMHRWRAHGAAAGIAWAFMVQGLLQLGPARTEGGWYPFVAWPVAILEQAVQRLIMYG